MLLENPVPDNLYERATLDADRAGSGDETRGRPVVALIINLVLFISDRFPSTSSAPAAAVLPD